MQIPLLVLVLGVLIPVSGFIAWAGDRIGHQVGKRRHSVFGLRPRHTAMMFTVGSGVGISVVSFLVLWLASEGFRVVLSQGVRLLTINKSLRAENTRLVSEVADRTRQTDTAKTDAQRALADRDAQMRLRDAATRQSLIARGELQKARASLSSAEETLHKAQTAFRETRGQLGVTTYRLHSVGQNLTSALSSLHTAQQSITAKQTALQQADEALAHAKASTELAKSGLQAAEAKTVETERNAQRTIRQVGKYAKEQTDKAEKERLASQLEVSKKQIELQGLQTEVASLQARRDDLAKQLSASLSSTTALRRRQITYRVGEEVGRISVASDQSVWRIESALDRFWNSTAKRAEERGATASGSDSTRAIAFTPRVMSTLSETHSGSGTAVDASLPSEEEVLRNLAQTIRRSEDPVAVVLVAAANAVIGEPVRVEVRTYRNPIVLSGGAKLGEMTINGGSAMTREAATDAVYEFLRRDVRKSLLSAGMIPTLSGDSEDGANSVVSLTGSEWLKIMDDLKRTDFRARLIVKTARTTRAADPVTLSFEIKALPAVPRYDSSVTSPVLSHGNILP